MRPAILIVEQRPDVAAALVDVIDSANYVPIVRPYLDQLTDLQVVPAAVIVRISFEGVSEPPHAWLERLPHSRPPIVAIAWEDAAIAEAQRLGCDVILHAPNDVAQLCDALARVIDTASTT